MRKKENLRLTNDKIYCNAKKDFKFSRTFEEITKMIEI